MHSFSLWVDYCDCYLGLIEVFREHISEALKTEAPQRFQLIEERPRLTQGVDISVDQLFPAPALLRNEASSLQHRNVLLHCGEAHRISPGQNADRDSLLHGELQNVTSRCVRQSVKQPIGLHFPNFVCDVHRSTIYNQMVVLIGVPRKMTRLFRKSQNLAE